MKLGLGAAGYSRNDFEPFGALLPWHQPGMQNLELSGHLSPLNTLYCSQLSDPRRLMSAVAAFRVSRLAKHFVQSSAAASAHARLTAGWRGCLIGSGGRPIAGVTRSLILTAQDADPLQTAITLIA